jgi:hypothetical protein
LPDAVRDSATRKLLVAFLNQAADIGGAGRYIAANDEVLKENLADGDGLRIDS